MNPKVIVITGASSGIGAALARSLSREGHALVLAARRADELNKVAEECANDVLAVPTDVTDRQAVTRLFKAAGGRFGHIDVWVNNAGQGIVKRVLDLTDSDVDDMIQMNAKSALYGMQAAMPPPKNLPPPQTPEAVAAVIAETIANPRDEVYTNPANAALLESRSR